MDLGLKDKVVMVAASSKGLGYGIARQAALEGAKLSLGSRYENNIRAAAEKLKNEVPGIHVHASILNVADPVSIFVAPGNPTIAGGLWSGIASVLNVNSPL